MNIRPGSTVEKFKELTQKDMLEAEAEAKKLYDAGLKAIKDKTEAIEKAIRLRLEDVEAEKRRVIERQQNVQALILQKQEAEAKVTLALKLKENEEGKKQKLEEQLGTEQQKKKQAETKAAEEAAKLKQVIVKNNELVNKISQTNQSLQTASADVIRVTNELNAANQKIGKPPLPLPAGVGQTIDIKSLQPPMPSAQPAQPVQPAQPPPPPPSSSKTCPRVIDPVICNDGSEYQSLCRATNAGKVGCRTSYYKY
jgi:hypothetical protein